MSFEPFPERVDPRKLFTRNGVIKGVIPLARLQRLGKYLSNEDGQVEAALSFERNDSNQRLISGPVTAKVQMLCQRCLTESSVELSAQLHIVVLSNTARDTERARSLLAKDVDAVQVDEDELDVLALIEDELILSLPIVVMHAENDCSKELNTLNASAEQKKPDTRRNAFAGLEALKKDLQ